MALNIGERTVTVPANDASHWRDFDNNPVTHSMAHYLMAINRLRKEFGYARSTDVARVLAVSRGAASMALAQLKKRDWITEDLNRFLLLTDEGARIAASVEENFTILSGFFERVLGASRGMAFSDACKMEHLMSVETGGRLLWFMKSLLDDPERLRDLRNMMEDYRDGEGVSAAIEGPEASESKPRRPSTARGGAARGGKTKSK
ncbi:MAG TPA: metal-dependent transcriptional regulator [Candidatus Hydrogenedentes bacterium]|nr:metal-dependent transcriptional regulator [Candidatus Hydrogenedentota bacterium]HNT88107.1 metal-dependent transcriptional regulator [Candidatus Hydrogenedentota bacterium]